MTNQINRNNISLSEAISIQTERLKATNAEVAKNNRVNGEPSFEELFNQQRNNQVSFSKHANLRTQERNIEISRTDMNRLGAACEKAEQKGIKDALIVMNDSAFIVNASNKVVITVIDKSEMKDNVFTHIDGAIFL